MFHLLMFIGVKYLLKSTQNAIKRRRHKGKKTKGNIEKQHQERTKKGWAGVSFQK